MVIAKLTVPMTWRICLVRLLQMSMLLARIQTRRILMEVCVGPRLSHTAIFAVAIVWGRYVLATWGGDAHNSCIIIHPTCALSCWSSRLQTIISLFWRRSWSITTSRSRVPRSVLGVNRFLLTTRSTSSTWCVVPVWNILVAASIRSYLTRLHRLIVMVILSNVALTLVSILSLRVRIFVDEIVIAGRVATTIELLLVSQLLLFARMNWIMLLLLLTSRCWSTLSWSISSLVFLLLGWRIGPLCTISSNSKAHISRKNAVVKSLTICTRSSADLVFRGHSACWFTSSGLLDILLRQLDLARARLTCCRWW